jgi:hypothetical protein
VSFIVTSKSARYPKTQPRLNPSWALSDRLQLLAVPNGRNYYDISGGSRVGGSLVGVTDAGVTTAAVAGVNHVWPQFPGVAGNWVRDSAMEGVRDPDSVTLAAWFRCDATTGTYGIASMGNGNARGYIRIYYAADTSTFGAHCDSLGAYSATSSVVVGGTGTLILGILRRNSNGSIDGFANGIAGPNAVPNGNAAIGLYQLLIGGHFEAFSNGTAPMDGAVGPVMSWDRALTDAECYSLYDPQTRWAMFAPPRKTYFIPAANAITLSGGGVVSTNPAAVVASVTSDISGGTLYYVSQLSSAAAPTIAQIKLGNNSANVAAEQSGSIS